MTVKTPEKGTHLQCDNWTGIGALPTLTNIINQLFFLFACFQNDILNNEKVLHTLYLEFDIGHEYYLETNYTLNSIVYFSSR